MEVRPPTGPAPARGGETGVPQPGDGDRPDFGAVFAALPGITLLLAADPPHFTMLAASDERLAATLTTRENTLGRPLFEIFSDSNPENGEPSGVRNLRASLETVLRTRAPHRMRVQRYDVRRPDGTWEVRHWAPRNVPVLGPGGEVRYLLHHVEDVTEAVRRAEDHARLQGAYAESEDARQELQGANVRLQDQRLELELANLRLQEQAAELGRQAEALQATIAELEARTAEAERARHEAARARRRLDDTFEAISDPFFTVDAEWRFTYVNPAAERVVGRPRAELIGKHLWEEFREAVGTAYYEHAQTAVRERRAVDFEAYYPPPLDLWTAMRVYPLGSADAPEGVAVYYQDVTARKRAEAALVESERQFRTLADAIPTLAWTARADGYLDWYNARWYAYTGTTPEQMEGWGWQAVHDPAALPDVVARWQTSLASGEPFEMTLPLRGADGRFRWFLTRVLPVRDAAGRVLRWFGTNTDVEAERGAREAAEQAAARTTLLQALTDALSRTLTREDVAAVVLDRVAAAFDAHLGVLALVTPEGDRLAVAAAERLRPETWQEWATFPLDAPVPLAEAARDGRTVALPTFAAIAARAPAVAEVCREYGTEAMCVVPVVASDGRVLGALGLSFPRPRAFDPELLALLQTLARQAAQALERTRLFEAAQAARVEAERRRAEAESANAAKSEFLSTMSHELRTPLNAIGGYTELMALGLRGPVTDEQRQDLERVRLANRHLMSLVTDILNFARLDAGRLEYRLADVGLASVVGDLEPMIGPQLVAKGVAFDHDACAPDAPDRPHLVRADPEKLRQILLNLLTNAVKFTEPGGRVAIACETDRRAGVVRVRVRDTGRGIAAEQLERIFEPFVQVDRHRTPESQQGVGLGLAISRDLARGMGGDLTVESTPGVGSTFTLTLPAAS